MYLRCIAVGMGEETTQPTRISKDEYKLFKQFVQDTHGQTRGHLKTEIENALREYRQPDDAAEPLHRIENDIATIKAQLADAQSDGGVGAVPTDVHARTPNETQTKPEPNAPRSKKVEWLVSQEYDRKSGSAKIGDIKNKVQSVYDFGERTAVKYVQPVIDELDGKRHPKNPELLIWGEQIETVKENMEKGLDAAELEEIEWDTGE